MPGPGGQTPHGSFVPGNNYPRMPGQGQQHAMYGQQNLQVRAKTREEDIGWWFFHCPYESWISIFRVHWHISRERHLILEVLVLDLWEIWWIDEWILKSLITGVVWSWALHMHCFVSLFIREIVICYNWKEINGKCHIKCQCSELLN